MTNSFMSSEDEHVDAEDCRTFIVRPLPWRNDKISDTFAFLDDHHKGSRNRRSAILTSKRTVGAPSQRAAPKGAPKFALKE